MAPVKLVLFFTYSEYRQSQIHLSTAYELLSNPNIEVHFASFEELAPRTVQISKLFGEQNPSCPKNEIKLHLIDYPAMQKLTLASTPMHPCGFWRAWHAYGIMSRILICWSTEQYIGIVQRCSEIVDEVRPDLVAVDSLFSQAIDMCRQKLARRDEGPHEGRAKYVILNPVDFSSTLMDAQPAVAAWWEFPACVGSQTPSRPFRGAP